MRRKWWCARSSATAEHRTLDRVFAACWRSRSLLFDYRRLLPDNCVKLHQIDRHGPPGSKLALYLLEKNLHCTEIDPGQSRLTSPYQLLRARMRQLPCED